MKAPDKQNQEFNEFMTNILNNKSQHDTKSHTPLQSNNINKSTTSKLKQYKEDIIKKFRKETESDVYLTINELQEYLNLKIDFASVIRDFKMTDVKIQSSENFELIQDQVHSEKDSENSKSHQESDLSINDNIRYQPGKPSDSVLQSCNEFNSHKINKSELLNEVTSDNDILRSGNFGLNEVNNGNKDNKDNNNQKKIFKSTNSELITKTSSLPASIIIEPSKHNSLNLNKINNLKFLSVDKKLFTTNKEERNEEQCLVKTDKNDELESTYKSHESN